MLDQQKIERLAVRLIALIMDTIIVGIVTFLFTWFGGFAFGNFMGFLAGAAYQAYFLVHRQGQTPGKSVMNLRVVKENGSPITYADAIVRYIGYYINTAVFFVGWLLAIIDQNDQGFHDRVARTLVIQI